MMEQETKENDTPMESTQEDTDPIIKEDVVEKKADKTESEKGKSGPLKDETPSESTNDADMPPPKPLEPSVEPKELVKVNEEMKECSEDIVMEEKEDGAATEKLMEIETTTTDAVKLPPRPIKKARTAYFIFADEKRAEIAARHPGEGVGAVARETGQLWSALTEEQKTPYHQQSAQEKERVAAELVKYKDLPDSALMGACSPTKPAVNSLLLPSARIRKICKLDPDVKGISKEALLLITKSAELFTSKLGLETVKVAALQNRRKLLPLDLAHVCSAREQFLFLKEDVRDLQQEMHQQALVNKAKTKSDTTMAAAAATTAKPLTDYFSAKQQQ